MNGCVQSMARRLEEAGFTLQSVFAMSSSIDAIDKAGAAEANLVVSSVGLPAAQYLQAQFGTPYVIGAPFGDFFSPYVFDALRESIRTGAPADVLGTFAPDAPDTVIVGESVTAKSLAAALAEKGVPMTVAALRNPYDLPLMPENAALLAAFDYSRDSLAALADVFSGGACCGVMPAAL